ncbi:peptide ABC transporter substrate-binding protein [Coraliomargarita sp. SDUM461003]|uniref:Peptide ABC transporter substrate-binding protein n=1 Tax=Thalassobacterium maritimum TaxID=3041265 RepID=A0ABU1AVW8_9BACT|nr:peptide ABC transporter substrate-binding protein [Coraliomargarita sp. SDUM461003]MDQ8207127.1 peptide ABC transporter substrate-binding protein [Coraliomargarita sp. SDUM461003]
MRIQFLPLCFTLLSAIACASFLGCAKGQSNVEKGNAEQELYIGIGTEPEGLDPHIVTGVTEHYVLLSLFEGLTTVHPETLEIEPGVAQSWELSADGLRYTFHLNPAARWSNGDPLTAEDFLFAYERILSPAMGAPYAYMLYCIRGAEAFNKGELQNFAQVGLSSPDPHTLIIELEAPTPYLLSLPTHYTWFPLHKASVLAHGGMTDRISKWTKPDNLVSNGPFQLDTWRLNHSIHVTKNPYYTAQESVRLQGIHFLPIAIDAEERAFRTQQLHITSTVPIPRIDWYRQNQPERMRFDTYLGVYYYAINTEHGPLKDARVRKALAYSIDREALTEHVLKAGQKPAYHFTPPNTGGYSAEVKLPYNPELARQLLAEAGYPGGEGFPTFELLFNTSESHRTVAVAIQQMWKQELGIDIGLYNQEWKVYLATRKARDFDIVRAAWIGDYVDPNTFLSLITSDNGNNHTNWGSAQYDQLIRQAATEQDPNARLDLFQKAEKILIEEMPVIPIYFYVRSMLIDESVQGWSPNILDYHPYQDVWLKPTTLPTDAGAAQ